MNLSQVAMSRQRLKFDFSDTDFEKVAMVARREFGLSLAITKKEMVRGRLAKRLQATGLTYIDDYLALIDHVDGTKERNELLSVLTTNLTHFFRENHHFDLLRDTILPRLLKSARSGKRVRIWSAGCSSGEEPYSIAMTVLDLCPEAAELDVKILATDIDPEILKRARSGVYSDEEVAPIAPALKQKHLEQIKNSRGTFKVGPGPRSLISFGELNLIKRLPFSGPIDVIFCRNVAIYFDDETQQTLWGTFAKTLTDNGYLIIGHSERISGSIRSKFESVATTAYRK